jgi:drug/metabolite transporter (DMT)-like permease
VNAPSTEAARLTPRDWTLLAFLTLVWGVNWPIMKAGVTDFPPLFFRTLSMWLGLPVLAAVLVGLRVPFRIERRHWRELAALTVVNMIVWHVLAIICLQALSSGRAAILGYTMPIFSALIGAALFGERLALRQVGGVVACAGAVGFLLWHELASLGGRPLAALGMLFAAAVWGYGTQRMRRTTIAAPTLAIAFWMTVATAVFMSAATTLFERDRWAMPGQAAVWAIVFNAALIFGFAQPVWLILARKLPPIASSMSVMMIPVLGVASGAWFLGERLYWQDGAAIVLILLAIGLVMARPRGPDNRAA